MYLIRGLVDGEAINSVDAETRYSNHGAICMLLLQETTWYGTKAIPVYHTKYPHSYDIPAVQICCGKCTEILACMRIPCAVCISFSHRLVEKQMSVQILRLHSRGVCRSTAGVRMVCMVHGTKAIPVTRTKYPHFNEITAVGMLWKARREIVPPASPVYTLCSH